MHPVSLSQRKHWTIPSEVTFQVRCMTSGLQQQAQQQDQHAHLQSCRELYTLIIFCCTDKETPHSETKPPTADPSGTYGGFGTKQQVQEITSFKREVGVKLTVLSYLTLSFTCKRRGLRGRKKKRVHLSLKTSSASPFLFHLRLQAVLDHFSFSHCSPGIEKKLLLQRRVVFKMKK